MEKEKLCELKKIADHIRLGVLEEVYSAASGHPGGSLSIAEILAYLYFAEMNVDPKNPKWEDRDRLVLSKGHTAPALYAVLAEKGFFPKEDLKTFRNIESYLQGHPDMKGTPGVDMTSGSLGLGISAACGMALSGKIRNKDYRVWAIMGDGELAELFFEVGELLHGEAAEALVSHKGVARHDSGGRYPEVFEVIEDLIGSVAHAVEHYRLF